jgi:hypothetical protein
MAFRNFEIRVEVQCCTVHPTASYWEAGETCQCNLDVFFFNVKSASTMSEKPMPHLEIASTCICTSTIYCNFCTIL